MKNSLKILIFLLLISAVFSCKKNEHQNLTNQKCVIPIWLNYDSTVLVVSDYADLNQIDSVSIENQKQSFDSVGNLLFITPSNAPNLMVMKIWTKSDCISILLKKSQKKSIEFSFDSKGKKYEKVQLKGEFNAWNPANTELINENGIWKTKLLVSKGKYQYLVVADGKEMPDPANPQKMDNNMGGFNSLLIVGDSNEIPIPRLSTSSFSDKEIQLEIQNSSDQLLAFWNNHLIESKDIKIESGKILIEIPSEATSVKRSFIRVFAANSSGFSNDILIPLENGKVLTDPTKLDRNDRQANILYNVFVDRFCDGDASNNRPIKDSVLPKANYNGGDVAGILKILNSNYFDELGVNTLWISPLVKNPEQAYGEWKNPYTKFSGYHGYWPISFTLMDDRFSKPEEFKNLVNAAHQKDKNVLLDFVAHHVHNTHPYFVAHPDCCTPLMLPDGSRNLERWDDHRLTTWFDVFLPTLNLEKPDIANMVADSAVWWIKTYGIDGFRHDAAKHVPLSFWHLLTQKLNNEVVKSEHRPMYQLGETYGSVELINSYVSSSMLDAQFDFNVYDAAIGAIAAGKSFNSLWDRLMESQQYYGSHNTMGYITGNQGRGRFISYAGGDLKFEENAKEAGWTRNIEVGNPVGYQRLAMLLAFNMTIPGLPVIYYGDEFGMPGGNDPDCRRMMRFGDQLSTVEKNNLEITKKLTKLRKSNMALLFGDFIYSKSDANILVYARKYFDNVVVVIFNNSDSTQKIKVEIPGLEKKNFSAQFGNAFQKTAGGIEINLKGNSFEIFTNK